MPFSEISRKIDNSELGMSAQIECGTEWKSIREFLSEHARSERERMTKEKEQFAQEQARKAQEAAEQALLRQTNLEHERMLNEKAVRMKELEIEEIRVKQTPTILPPTVPHAPVVVPPPSVIMVRPTKSRGVYIILALFFGCLGIHNFYAGHNGRGAAQLIITILLGWLIIGWVITGLWALIEAISETQDGGGQRMT